MNTFFCHIQILVFLYLYEYYFVNFIGNGNRYKFENFSVYTTFNDLSNGISFVYVA